MSDILTLHKDARVGAPGEEARSSLGPVGGSRTRTPNGRHPGEPMLAPLARRHGAEGASYSSLASDYRPAIESVAGLISDLATCEDATQVLTTAIGCVQDVLDAAGTRLSICAHQGVTPVQSLALRRGPSPLVNRTLDERGYAIARGSGRFRAIAYDPDGRQIGLSTQRAVGLSLPLRAQGRTLGAMSVSRSDRKQAFAAADIEAARWLAATIGYALQSVYEATTQPARIREGRRGAAFESRSLVRMVRVHDEYTCKHSLRVAKMGRRLAVWAGLGAAQAERVRLGSLLHDVGKLGIPRRTLTKTGALSARERAEIEQHPRIGARILDQVASLDYLAPTVRYHHEWPDGSGYPDGLPGNEIPIEARIVAVADVYDSLLYDRPYRAAQAQSEVAAYLDRVAGTQLDAALVRTFLSHLPRERAAAAS